MQEGAGAVVELGGLNHALEESFEDGEGLGDDVGLAGSCSEDRADDVEDAGVQIVFDDGREDVGGVDEGGEGVVDDGHACFVGELGRASGGVLGGKVGEDAGKDEDDDAGEFEELFDVFGKVVLVSVILAG